MTRGIIYFNAGTKCIVRLATSLFTLRQHYSGAISIICSGADSLSACKQLLGGNRLDVELIEAAFPDIPEGANTVLLQKTAVNRFAPYDVCLYLDSDTLIHGQLDELWAAAEIDDFVVPQFANWKTAGGGVRKRILAWQDVYPELIDAALSFGPAINTGVFAFRRNTPLVTEWLDRIRPGRGKFIPDETGLQVILHQYRHRVMDQKFNVSCKYSNPYDSDVRAVHYHGRKHCRTDQNGKPLFGAELWLRAFEKARESGDVIVSDQRVAEDRTLRQHLSRCRPARTSSNKVNDDQITLVTAVNRPYLDKLKATLPTWSMKPQLARCPLLVFYHDLTHEDLNFVSRCDRPVKLIPWSCATSTSMRELMLASFVFGSATHVDTKYWVKLDADAFFVDPRDVFAPHMFDYDLAGHKWRYTKPGSWLPALDCWAQAAKVPGEAYLSPEQSCLAIESKRYGHRRIASWLCLHKSDFTREAAQFAGDRMPVPSHDTFLWYLAQRLPYRRWCWHNFKTLGAGNETSLARLSARLPPQSSYEVVAQR